MNERKSYYLNNSYYLKQSEVNQSERSPDGDEVWDHYWEEFEHEAIDLRKETTI